MAARQLLCMPRLIFLLNSAAQKLQLLQDSISCWAQTFIPGTPTPAGCPYLELPWSNLENKNGIKSIFHGTVPQLFNGSSHILPITSFFLGQMPHIFLLFSRHLLVYQGSLKMWCLAFFLACQCSLLVLRSSPSWTRHPISINVTLLPLTSLKTKADTSGFQKLMPKLAPSTSPELLLEMQILWLLPRSPESQNWGWYLAICALRSPPEVSHAWMSVRSTDFHSKPFKSPAFQPRVPFFNGWIFGEAHSVEVCMWSC